MTFIMPARLLTLYTRTPLHVGCGLSVDVVDLPVTRERVTQFPVVPSRVLKGALRDAAQNQFLPGDNAKIRLLFGEERKLNNDPAKGEVIRPHAGSLQIIEAKLLAFPVRALKGCFAWLTCPAILHRFARDTRKLSSRDIPAVAPDRALVAPKSDLLREDKVFLEEFRLQASLEPAAAHRAVAAALKSLCDDTLWQSKLPSRLAILNDEDFQHFVTTCTEIAQRAAIDPETRTFKPGGVWSQEYLPCETLFYSVLTLLPPENTDAEAGLGSLLDSTPTLQVGGDKTTGHGLCTAKHEAILERAEP